MPTDYATIAELAERVGANSASNSLMQQYLDSAANVIDGVTRKPPNGAIAYSATPSGVVRYYNDVLRDRGLVYIDDCLAITKVQRASTVLDATAYKAYPYNELPWTELYLNMSVMFIDNALFGANSWYGSPFFGEGAGAIAIEGTWGYCQANARPPVVKEATLQLATLYYQKKSVSISDLLGAIGNPSKKAEGEIMQMLYEANLVRYEQEKLFA